MTIAAELHRAHQQRLQRIAARAVAPPSAPPVQPAQPPKDFVRIKDRIGRNVGYLSDDTIRETNAAIRAVRPISVATIQAKVAEAYGLTTADILSPRRIYRLSFARHVAMYLSRQMTPSFGLPEIGRRFGGRDHTTVLHAVHHIGQLVKIDPSFAAKIDALRAAIIAERAEP